MKIHDLSMPAEADFEEWNELFGYLPLDGDAFLYTLNIYGTIHHVISTDTEIIKGVNMWLLGSIYEDEDVRADEIFIQLIEFDTKKDASEYVMKSYKP